MDTKEIQNIMESIEQESDTLRDDMFAMASNGKWIHKDQLERYESLIVFQDKIKDVFEKHPDFLEVLSIGEELKKQEPEIFENMMREYQDGLKKQDPFRVTPVKVQRVEKEPIKVKVRPVTLEPEIKNPEPVVTPIEEEKVVETVTTDNERIVEPVAEKAETFTPEEPVKTETHSNPYIDENGHYRIGRGVIPREFFNRGVEETSTNTTSGASSNEEPKETFEPDRSAQRENPFSEVTPTDDVEEETRQEEPTVTEEKKKNKRKRFKVTKRLKFSWQNIKQKARVIIDGLILSEKVFGRSPEYIKGIQMIQRYRQEYKNRTPEANARDLENISRYISVTQMRPEANTLAEKEMKAASEKSRLFKKLVKLARKVDRYNNKKAKKNNSYNVDEESRSR